MATPKKPRRAPRRRDGTIKDPSGITYRKADATRVRPFQFAWANRVLRGYINLLVGEEGVGKGVAAAYIGAGLTNGTLPGNLQGKPSYFVVVGDEDSYNNIWTPRFVAAEANLDYCEHILYGPDGGTLDVYRDARALQRYIKERNGRVVMFFDQFLDNLGATDSWKDKQVRDATAPLRNVAENTSVAFLASLHPNKRGGTFRQRVSGTVAFNALSRSSMLITNHPDVPNRRVITRPKGNYNVEPPAFEFDIDGYSYDNKVKVGRSVRTFNIVTQKIVNTSESNLTADDVLDESVSRKRPDSQAGQARAFLIRLFADGKNRLADDVRAEANGIPWDALTRQTEDAGLTKWQEGFPGVWWWGPKTNKIKLSKGQ